MAKRKVIDREDQIDELDIETLRERLKLAEEVAVVFGWCASRRDESPRDRLAFDAWNRWYRLVGVDAGGPQGNPRLNAELRHVEGRR